MNPPPLLVSFSELQLFLRAAPHISGNSDARAYFTNLYGRRFPPCVDAISLAVLFGYSPRFIMSMANKPAKHYRQFSIRLGKKPRKIDAPRVGLKCIQAWFGYHLSRAVTLPDCVHGFVPGRSTVTAAKVHLQSDWVAAVDIRDFFPSTRFDRIERLLADLEYPKLGSNILARLLTLNGALPQGSPASPVLANLVFTATDEKLQALAASRDSQITRYADDIVMSGKGRVPSNLIQQMEAIISEDGWTVAKDKTTVQQAPRARKVHGILVHGKALRLPKKYRNRIRMMKYATDKFTVDEGLKHVYRGHISYASSVYDGLIDKL